MTTSDACPNARDKKAIDLFGEFAWLNFPPEAGGQTTEDRPTPGL